MKEISLTKEQNALVDDEYYEILSKHKWHFGARGYAMRTVSKGYTKDGKRIQNKVWMHREIMKTPKDLFTDHINGNRLDNRKENLRVVTQQENAWNMNIPSHNTSGYKGVSKRGNRYEASIHLNNKKKHIGYFSTSNEAAKAYNQEAVNIFREYAKLNNLDFFDYQYIKTMEELRDIIKNEEVKCVQQCCFSTFHDALTQINFTKRIIRSNIKL